MLLNLHCEHVTVINVDVTEEDIVAFLNRELENRDGCRNMITAVFYRETVEVDFIFDNRIKMSFDSEKITNALPSYEQEILQTAPFNSKRLWRENRTNFIDVVTHPEDFSSLALLKDQNIQQANESESMLF